MMSCWAGEDKVSGADCPIAWDHVATPKSQGGLGVRNLATQNKCLLLKLLHRLRNPAESSWALWLQENADIATMSGDIASDHWENLRELQPIYQDLTVVEIGDGKNTSFWRDNSCNAGRLADKFPALYSHSRKPAASVHSVLLDGLQTHLVPRITRAASAEFQDLNTIISQTALSAAKDRRLSPLITPENKLKTGPVYQLMVENGGCDFSEFVWKNKTPARVQFLMWLLVQERIKCRANLLLKKIVSDTVCELCNANNEDSNRIIFICPTAQAFWKKIGVQINQGTSVRKLWEIQKPDHLPARNWNSFLHLCCRHIWRHRNEVIFCSEPPFSSSAPSALP